MYDAFRTNIYHKQPDDSIDDKLNAKDTQKHSTITKFMMRTKLRKKKILKKEANGKKQSINYRMEPRKGAANDH